MSDQNMDCRQLLDKLAQLLEMEKDAQPEDIYRTCEKIKQERDTYFLAMDNCLDSFHVTDRDGNIIFVNKTFERRSKTSKDFILGKSVTEMEELGFYRPSAVRIALREGRPITMVQAGPGGDAIVTATPIKDADGQAVMCVSNARFTDELELLDKYYRGRNKQPDYDEKSIVTKNAEVAKLYESARQVAKADSSILITGETGTGKSMLAKYIHDNSQRAKGKFIELNCAAIPENLIESELFGYESGAFTGAKKGGKPGLFEMADGGSLFLDEIGDMPLNLQVKLLHAIQNRIITRIGGTAEKPVNVRIITATNKNLEKLVEEGLFRSDLYYRIHVVPLHMPALRQRKEDIDELVKSFLQLFNNRYGSQVEIVDEALEILNEYRWPGNIRELENLIERLVVTNRTGVIDEETLPNHIKIMTDGPQADVQVNRIIPLRQALEQVEAQLIHMTFQEYPSTYKAAKALGISQSGASRKFLKYQNQEPHK
ncbi:sigma 54-interacting transcriptional regulator [Anaerovorax odorimutans]|nr:sigma 54-interacting transcriptional regulator [Anaerovorax odorimutans]